MKKKIVIIGEKSVGKTTIFFQLFEKKIKTNDKSFFSRVNYFEQSFNIREKSYELVDTPSFILFPKNEIEKSIRKNLQNLLERSDLILWVIDELNENSILISKILKKIRVPKILLINKVDILKYEERIEEYRILKIDSYIFIPLSKKINIERISEEITKFLPFSEAFQTIKENKKNFSLLIFGAPNSGKSTLMNCLINEERSLVTKIAGTTKESVSSKWNWKDIDFQLIDTAGITKEKKIKVELWKKSDITWVVVDASLSITKQILQIVNLAEKYNKPLVIIINKCDLIKKKNLIAEEIRSRLKSLNYCPIVFISALEKKGINFLVLTLKEMLRNSQLKLTKSKSEKLVEKIVENNNPNYYQGGKLKIYYFKHEPGLIHYFIFFVNNPKWVHFSYLRYISNFLRKNLDLKHLPIKVFLRKSA